MYVKQTNLFVLLVSLFPISQTQNNRRMSFDIVNIDILYENICGYDTTDCVQSEIPILHEKRRAKIRKIEGTNQMIPILPEQMIANFLRLEKICLRGNNITKVQTAAFANLPLLNSVDLSNNTIVTMDLDVFVNVPQLRRIHLQRNRLFYFEQAWLGYVPELEWLSLDQNLLKTITIGSFSNFPNLLYLNLAHNHIMHIDKGGLHNLNHLVILDLSYNRIKELHDNVFIAVQGLHVLNLYSNELNYISDLVLMNFSELRELVTLFNPWQCGCYDKIDMWAQSESVRMNKNKYLKCTKTQDVDNIPKCVLCSGEDQCVENRPDDLCDILYSQLDDFECSFDYPKYFGL